MNTYDKPCYLAGPMTGIPSFNYPAFDEAAAELRKMGYEITNPTELDPAPIREEHLVSPDGVWIDDAGTWGEVLGRDVRVLADECAGIILLPGWEKSKGARLECFVAIGCGYDCYFWYPEYSIVALTQYETLMNMIRPEVICVTN